MARNYYVLSKKEWERLKKQGSSLEEAKKHEVGFNDRFKHLNELSQKWMQTWPDTVQGHMANLEKERKNHKLKAKAIVEEFRNRKIYDGRPEAIRQAKEKIFQNSCYGRQLTSAVIEYKAIEEREAQIKLKKDQIEKAKIIDQELIDKNNIIEMAKFKADDEKQLIKEAQTKEMYEFNRKMHQDKISKITEENAREKEMERSDVTLANLITKSEKEQNEKCDLLWKKSFDTHEVDEKKYREVKARAQEVDDALVAFWRKHYDCLRDKKQRFVDEMHHGRYNTPESQKLYDMVKKILEEEQKRYDLFIEKGIQHQERRLLRDEEAKMEKEKDVKSRKQEESNYNKLLMERNEFTRRPNLCSCERQSLFTKPRPNPQKMFRDEEKICVCCDKAHRLTFLSPQTTLIDQLREQEKVPSPWTGVEQKDKQFADAATSALKESQYSHMAKRVIDNYRKVNNLDATTLPVENY